MTWRWNYPLNPLHLTKTSRIYMNLLTVWCFQEILDDDPMAIWCWKAEFFFSQCHEPPGSFSTIYFYLFLAKTAMFCQYFVYTITPQNHKLVYCNTRNHPGWCILSLSKLPHSFNLSGPRTMHTPVARSLHRNLCDVGLGNPGNHWHMGFFSGFSRLFVPSPAALRTSATRFFAGRQFIARVAAHFASLQGPRKLGRWAWLCLMWEGPPQNPPRLIIIFPLKWNFWIIFWNTEIFEQMHMPDTRGHFYLHQSEMSRSILALREDFKTDDMELSMYFYCSGAGGTWVGKTGFFRNGGNGGTPDVARVGTKISGISGHVAWNSHEIQVWFNC